MDRNTGVTRSVRSYTDSQTGQQAADMKYRFQWNAPIRISPHDPDTVYHASQYIHRSVCETEANRVVCTTEAVESGPGIRARLTLEIIDRYRFVERYELAFPGKELELFFEIQWTRKPVLDVWN